MLSDREIENTHNTESEFPTFTELFGLGLRRWKFVSLFSLICAVLAALITLLIPNKYTASTTSLPAGGESRTGGVMSLVENTSGLEMLGLNADKNAPSRLYPEILKSRMLAEEVLEKEYSYVAADRIVNADLYDYFDIENPDLAYRALCKITGISYDKKTGIVELSVTTRYPELSAAVANYYMDRLDEFNKHKRKSSAALKRQFIESRIVDNKAELEKAEEALKDFRENNRHYLTTTDPLILMEHQRLLRDVEVKAQVYQMLAEEYEMAAIQEKKETPVIQTLDIARPPSVKSGPARTKITLLAFIAGFFMSIFILVSERNSNSYLKRSGIDRLTSRLRFISKSREEKPVELEQRH